MTKRRHAYHFILLFIIISAFVSFIPNPALLSKMANGTVVEGSPPPSTGPWDIGSDTMIEDELYIINGSIRILSGANLTLTNVTLWMNCASDGEYNITVYDGGELYIHNCTITAYNTDFSWYLTAKSGSLVLLNESTFSYAGYTHGSYGSFSGLHFGTDKAMVLNCTIHHNYYGLSFSGGLSLSGINYCTIKNNNISHSSKYGLYFSNFRNSTISENIVTNSSLDGIYLNSAYNNTLSSNTVTNSSDNGIYLLSNVDNNTLSGNTVTNSSLDGILLSNADNNTLSGNTVTNSSLDGIRLTSADNNTLSGNTVINSSSDGIRLTSADNNTLSGNTVTNSSEKGIFLEYADNNTLSGNTVTNSSGTGIRLWDSENNTLSGNTVTNSSNFGIFLKTSENNTLSGNTVTRSSLDGIRLEQSNSSTLSGNSITNSGQNGILQNTCENTTLSGNIVTSSWIGISLSFSKNCSLSTNRITQCDWDGISLWSSNSLTVFNNTVTYSSEVGIDLENSGGCLLWGNMLASNDISANDDNGTNSWDNGTYGNWWDDYIGPDWNHDGIGDIPYDISSSSGTIFSQDRFPLMNITDNDDPMLSTPSDIEYTEGDTGYTIQWYCYDTWPYWFNITCNDKLIQDGPWNGSDILLRVEGLSPGGHKFMLTVFDLLGNQAKDMVVVVVLADTKFPRFNQPLPEDVTLEEGQFRYNVTWYVEDEHPSTYILYLNGIIHQSDNWTSTTIVFEIRFPTPGVYNYTLVVFDIAGNSISDTVFVTVPPQITQSSSSSEPPSSEEDDESSASSPGFGIYVVLISCIVGFLLDRRRKH